MEQKNKEIVKVVLAAFSDKGTVRDNNEDNLYSSVVNVINEKSDDSYKKTTVFDYSEQAKLFAVFDGIGGSYGGEIASLCAAKVFSEFYHKITIEDINEPSDILSELKSDIEKSILQKDGFNAKNMPGTTCCALLIQNGKVLPFWVGDSRIYMLRGNKLILLTKDHTVAQEKIDYGILTPEEAVTISGWHHLTAYIGDLNSNFSIGKEFELEAGDKFLLCTDGISDKYKAIDIANYMNNGVEECLKAFEKDIKEESKDNATAMLIEFKKSERFSLGDILKIRSRT